MLKSNASNEKPDTLTAALYILTFVLCGYIIIRVIILFGSIPNI